MDKLISKYFDTLGEAERYQDELYSEHEKVECLRTPSFEEAGTYVWRVGEDSRIKKS